MADDPWIERNSRVPVIGIIAIVLIVAIVSFFLKPYVLPDSPVTVTSDNLQGRASASFAGMREVPLQQKAYLGATLSTPGGARMFTVDVPARMLIITEDGNREEIELSPKEDALVATFEYNGRSTRVDIRPTERTMAYSEPGYSAVTIDLVLSEVVTWQGIFNFRNSQYLFQFYPAGSRATISSDSIVNINLAQSGSLFTGTWNDGNNARPVTVDVEKRVATVEEVY
jgi:hypothetical protein